jgi:F0F1-type ATP synthase assembly protein I
MSDDKDGSDRGWRQALSAVGLALAIPWLIAMPTWLGWYVDKKYGTSPIFLLIFLFFGLTGSALDIYKILKMFGQLD